DELRACEVVGVRDRRESARVERHGTELASVIEDHRIAPCTVGAHDVLERGLRSIEIGYMHIALGIHADRRPRFGTDVIVDQVLIPSRGPFVAIPDVMVGPAGDVAHHVRFAGLIVDGEPHMVSYVTSGTNHYIRY